MTPRIASYAIFALWLVSWMAAAVWSRRSQSHPPSIARALDLIPTCLGAGLLFNGAGMRAGYYYAISGSPLWTVPAAMSWALTALVLAGIAFTWWARLTLGDLWSGSVSRKEGHVVIQTGPYRLVRHPIYTGLIFAAWALAAQIGAGVSLAGAALITLGFWIKARLEERFLSAELGEAAYADYRRRTPMLIPFWPAAG